MKKNMKQLWVIIFFGVMSFQAHGSLTLSCPQNNSEIRLSEKNGKITAVLCKKDPNHPEAPCIVSELSLQEYNRAYLDYPEGFPIRAYTIRKYYLDTPTSAPQDFDIHLPYDRFAQGEIYRLKNAWLNNLTYPPKISANDWLVGMLSLGRFFIFADGFNYNYIASNKPYMELDLGGKIDAYEKHHVASATSPEEKNNAKAAANAMRVFLKARFGIWPFCAKGSKEFEAWLEACLPSNQ